MSNTRLHAYNGATGELKGVCLPIANGQKLVWENEYGWTVVEGPVSVDGVRVSMDEFNYLGGVLTRKIPVTLTPSKDSILADSSDECVVAIQGNTPSVELQAEDADGSISAEITLTAGSGNTPGIRAEAAGNIVISAVDNIKYRCKPIIIKAVNP